jgi:hypothetical protein
MPKTAGIGRRNEVKIAATSAKNQSLTSPVAPLNQPQARLAIRGCRAFASLDPLDALWPDQPRASQLKSVEMTAFYRGHDSLGADTPSPGEFA